MDRTRGACRQNRSSPCRAGFWRHPAVLSLCAIGRGARRACGPGGAAAAQALVVGLCGPACGARAWRAIAALRSALSAVQPAARVRHAASDDPADEPAAAGPAPIDANMGGETRPE